MADDTPDKITFGIGQGYTRKMVRLADGSYADTSAPAFGAGIVTDNTGEFIFDTVSLASRLTYDSEGNQTSITYGPDRAGRRIRQTSVYENGLMVSDTDWQLVDSNGAAVKGDGSPL